MVFDLKDVELNKYFEPGGHGCTKAFVSDLQVLIICRRISTFGHEPNPIEGGTEELKIQGINMILLLKSPFLIVKRSYKA